MKSVSVALDAHLQEEVTTPATCRRIIRIDGAAFYFTDHDRDLDFDGSRYVAATGYSRSAIASDASFGVDNLDVEGVFDNDAITDGDLKAGLFDHAPNAKKRCASFWSTMPICRKALCGCGAAGSARWCWDKPAFSAPNCAA